MFAISRKAAFLAISFALLTVGFCAGAGAARAQSPAIDSMKAEVKELQAIVNVLAFRSRQIPCDSMEARRPKAWFPNGEYDLAYRNRQFGCAFDPVAATTQSIAGRFEGVVARLGLLENRLNSLESRPNAVVAIDSAAIVRIAQLEIAKIPAATNSPFLTSIRFNVPALNQTGLGIDGKANGLPGTAEIQYGGDAGFRRAANMAAPKEWPGAGTITIHDNGSFEISSPVPAGISAPGGVIWWANGGNGIKSLAADRMSGTTWSGRYPEGTYVVTKYTQSGQLNPWLPSFKDGADWTGTFGWQYSQPEKSAFVPGDYGVKGDFLLRLGFNFDTDQLGTGRYDTFFDLNPGRGFEVRLNQDGIYGSVSPVFRLTAGSTDLNIEGALRRLRICNVGGVQVVCL